MLSILFLGTGAADWPSEYTATKEQARQGEMRGLSSILVDGHVLVDCGSTVPDAMDLFDVDPCALTDLLVTHSHGDHFSTAAVERVLKARAGRAPLQVWAYRAVADRLSARDGIQVHALEAGEEFSPGGLSVVALPANHEVEAGDQALHFLIRKAETTVLYATDGAWLLKPTWLQLREERLDLVIWDATLGDSRGDWRVFEHNSVDMIRVMRETLRQQGVVTDATDIVLTHLSRTLCAPHVRMSEDLAEERLVPAHDGMVVQVADGSRPIHPRA